jgi:predicted type IV restriction endonuclease
MTGAELKAVARARIGELVQSFRRNETDYLRAAYNETQARTDFITPLLAAFGWDVHNAAGQPLGLREVIEEATVEVGEEKLSKKPDYELRFARQAGASDAAKTGGDASRARLAGRTEAVGRRNAAR